MATYLHETWRDAAQQADAAWNDKLRAGDTLVVSKVGALGESHGEISRALRDLIQRRIKVRFVEEGLTFDGRAAEGGASREAMILVAAAPAQASKATARRAMKMERSLTSVAFPDWAGGSGALQLRVIGVQLAALGLVIYLFNYWAPNFRRPSPQQVPQSEASETVSEAPVEPLRYSDRPFLVEKEAGFDQRQDRVSEANRLAGGENEVNSTNAAPAFSFSDGQEMEVFATVGDWRSARVRGAGVPIMIGAAVPPDVHLAIFPRRLVARRPLLGKFRFIIAERRIAVIDPGPRRIVAVLHRPESR